MKIIKGPPHADWKGHIRCRQCKAVLEYIVADVTADYTDFRDGPWFSVVCPCCKTKLTVTRPPGL